MGRFESCNRWWTWPLALLALVSGTVIGCGSAGSSAPGTPVEDTPEPGTIANPERTSDVGDDDRPPATAPDSPDGDEPAEPTGPTSNPDEQPSDEPTRVDVGQLILDGTTFVGTTVTVIGKAFFLETCPPPGAENPGPCVLTLYLTEPVRDDLLYGDRHDALPVWEGGQSVSCTVGPLATTACPGWEHRTIYELQGRVETRPGTGPGVALNLSE